MNRTAVAGAFVAVAIVAAVIGRYSGTNRPPVVGPKGPIAVGATIDLKCGDRTYTVSTGNSQGDCTAGPTTPAGQATCTDGKGNAAEVSCAHGCMNSHGSGSCSIKQ